MTNITKQTNLLPDWSKDYVGIPNALARSALFGVGRKVDRKIFDDEVIASNSDITLTYKGEELRQDDLDVFLKIIDIAKSQQLGERVTFTANSLLSRLGRASNSPSYARLSESLVRMVDGTIQVTVRHPSGITKHFRGHLISSFTRVDKDIDISSMWVVSLEAGMVVLFAPQAFSLIRWSTRISFSPVTKWLHAYYSTHKRPFSVKVETLRRAMASETKNTRNFRISIKESLQSLVDIGFFLTAHVDPVTDLVHVERAADRKLLE